MTCNLPINKLLINELLIDKLRCKNESDHALFESVWFPPMKFLSIFYHSEIITRTNYTGYLVHVFKYPLHLTPHHATEYCVSVLRQKANKIYNSAIPNIFFTSSYEHVTHQMLSNVTGNTLCVTKLHYEFLLEARTKRDMLNLFHVCKYRVRYIKIRGTS